jgi:putative transposase
MRRYCGTGSLSCGGSEMERLDRKNIRLEGYDYSTPGGYFVTVCTKEKRKLFWDGTFPVGADIIRPGPPTLSQVGQIVDRAIREIPDHYPHAKINKYAVMPNHVHMILILEENGRIISAPTKSVSTIIGQVKRISSKLAGQPIWQKGFYDHVIRDEADHLRIWEYIDTNPGKWQEDCYYIL